MFKIIHRTVKTNIGRNEMLLIHKIKKILLLQSGSKSVKLVDIDVDITMILSVHEVPHTVLSQR